MIEPTALTLEEVKLARQQLDLYKLLPCYATIARVLDERLQSMVEPIVFKMADAGMWLVGKGEKVRKVEGKHRGLMPAWTVFVYGSANLSDFAFDDEVAAFNSIRRSLHDTCVAWANQAGCPDLAAAFLSIKVSNDGRITYTGSRLFDTQ